MRGIFTFVSIGITLLGCAAAPARAAADAQCGDLLDSLHKKPAHVEYLGCKERPDLQGQPFEAKYRVKGSDAAEAEAYLLKAFRIKKLARTCCVWESVNNSYHDARKRPFTITMSTEETTVDKREQWGKVDYFYIVVDLYRDEP